MGVAARQRVLHGHRAEDRAAELEFHLLEAAEFLAEPPLEANA
jgi:hypothetical protein